MARRKVAVRTAAEVTRILHTPTVFTIVTQFFDPEIMP
jgi:hypothetical protein